jgi:hypothetical protein
MYRHTDSYRASLQAHVRPALTDDVPTHAPERADEPVAADDR